jgi:hypothetical protein
MRIITTLSLMIMFCIVACAPVCAPSCQPEKVDPPQIDMVNTTDSTSVSVDQSSGDQTANMSINSNT